jgi:hypothetical protein
MNVKMIENKEFRKMLHLAKLIQRRFPAQANKIIAILAVLSVAGIAVGLILLLLN